MNLIRFTVSIEKSLYYLMGQLLKRGRYTNRSEFIRDLIREHIVNEEWKSNEVVLGTITLIYDHHKWQLSERLTDLQHQYHREVLAATHVHLDKDLCAETILVRARARKIEELANCLRREKGVLHTSLSMGSVGKQLV